MSLNIDVKEVLQDVGTSYSVVSGELYSAEDEYLDYDMNTQVTKPFIREHFLEATLPYDTSADVGDVVELSDGRRFLVMNRTAENFENSIVSYDAVLFKTNIKAIVLRPSGEHDSDSYRYTESWQTITSGVDALLTDKMFGAELNDEMWIGKIPVEGDELYISDSIGVRSLDRIVVSGEYAGGMMSGECYMVEVVETRRYPGVSICHLVEDTR